MCNVVSTRKLYEKKREVKIVIRVFQLAPSKCTNILYYSQIRKFYCI